MSAIRDGLATAPHGRLVAALTAALDLADEYERDDVEHLDRFGQHHPVAYHPYPRIRAVIEAALTEEES